MKKIMLVLCFFVIQNSYSQLNLDSLWKIYHNPNKPDTTRLMAMWFIAYDGYLYNNPDSSFILAQQMYDFAKKKGELQFQGYALGTQGAACYYLGKLDLSIEYHERALKIHQKLKNYGSVASTYNNIANTYRKRVQNENAITYYLKALKIYEKKNDKEAIGSVYVNLGAAYAGMEDFNNSTKWYNKALIVKKQTNDKIGLSLLLAGIGTQFLQQGIYDSAMYYQNESLKIRKSINNKNGIASSLKYIGEVFYASGELDSAMVYFKQSLSQFEDLKTESGITDVCFNIAEVYEKQGDYTRSMIYAKRSLSLSNKWGFADTERDVSLMLFRLYKLKGDYISALKMHENYILMRDKIEQESNQKATIELQFQYDYEKKVIADSLNRVKEKNLEDLRHSKETEKQQIIIASTAGGFALVLLFSIVVFNRLRITKKQKLIIEDQKLEVEEKNKEILDSISYAKRIQSAILPTDKIVKEYLQDSFILYKPKDIVAGDFYWMQQQDNKVLFAAADCTGHGVPGAMVSVVCHNALNRSVKEYGLTDPGQILDKTREIVIEEFEKSDQEVKDGMDIALCVLDGNKLCYAGANIPLWIIRNGKLLETKADKQPIGKFDKLETYTTHSYDIQQGDSIYLFSDGYVDQFGGVNGKKFMVKTFRELLLGIHEKSMHEQKIIINESFENWKGKLDQVDDVCVIGVRF